MAEFDYDLLADGRRSGVTEIDHEGNHTRIDWLYDGMGRLVGEAYDSHDDMLDFITSYQFDLVSNRLEKATNTDPTSQEFDAFVASGGDIGTVVETVAYSYDDNDRLLTETKDGPGTAEDRYTEYEYGGVGNPDTQQTSKIVYEGLNDQGDIFSEAGYKYNRQGRLWIAELDTDGNGAPNSTTEYKYDDNGIRYSQNVDGQNTLYLYDHHNPTGYAQILHEGIDANSDGNLAASEIERSYVLGHDVISQAIHTGPAAGVHFLLYDAHGSTRALFSPAGVIPGQAFAYDAYGNAIGFSEANALTALLYSGELLDYIIGMQYLRARYYDLATGTFNRFDPFAGLIHEPQTLHKRLYVHGDPIQGSDPTGLFSTSQSLSAIAVAIPLVSGTVNHIQAARHAINREYEIAAIYSLMGNIDYFTAFAAGVSGGGGGGAGAAAVVTGGGLALRRVMLAEAIEFGVKNYGTLVGASLAPLAAEAVASMTRYLMSVAGSGGNGPGNFESAEGRHRGHPSLPGEAGIHSPWLLRQGTTLGTSILRTTLGPSVPTGGWGGMIRSGVKRKWLLGSVL